nr:radical SAM protein [bacterium]
MPPRADAQRSVYIETYGCQMNTYDSSAIGGILSDDGYDLSRDPAAADIILLNTCSVRDLAEHKIHSRIGELRSLRRRGLIRADVIGVCGCMAERLADDLARGQGQADLVAGVDQYGKLPAMLADLFDGAGPASRVATGHQAEMHYVAPPEAYPTNNSHLVTIHKGCDYHCTYCIVPATRGPQREKAPAAILDEIRDVVAAGGREVTLLGQNVTAYRAPDLDFAGLLERVAGIDGLERIRFLTGHPCDMDEGLLRTIGEQDKVCPWLHL